MCLFRPTVRRQVLQAPSLAFPTLLCWGQPLLALTHQPEGEISCTKWAELAACSRALPKPTMCSAIDVTVLTELAIQKELLVGLWICPFHRRGSPPGHHCTSAFAWRHAGLSHAKEEVHFCQVSNLVGLHHRKPPLCFQFPSCSWFWNSCGGCTASKDPPLDRYFSHSYQPRTLPSTDGFVHPFSAQVVKAFAWNAGNLLFILGALSMIRIVTQVERWQCSTKFFSALQNLVKWPTTLGCWTGTFKWKVITEFKLLMRSNLCPDWRRHFLQVIFNINIHFPRFFV